MRREMSCTPPGAERPKASTYRSGAKRTQSAERPRAEPPGQPKASMAQELTPGWPGRLRRVVGLPECIRGQTGQQIYDKLGETPAMEPCSVANGIGPLGASLKTPPQFKQDVWLWPVRASGAARRPATLRREAEEHRVVLDEQVTDEQVAVLGLGD